MLINKPLLDLAFKGFKTVYTQANLEAPPEIEKIAMPDQAIGSSASRDENYAWIGNLPRPMASVQACESWPSSALGPVGIAFASEVVAKPARVTAAARAMGSARTHVVIWARRVVRLAIAYCTPGKVVKARSTRATQGALLMTSS